MSDIVKQTCIGCHRKIETNDPVWDKEYSKWKYTPLGMTCPTCYPIYRNILPLLKKEFRANFKEARAEMTFRFNDNLINLY